jgi:hypothetical protein
MFFDHSVFDHSVCDHSVLPSAGAPQGPPSEDGFVTAETAVTMPALVVVLVLAMVAVGASTAQLRCAAAAREVARAVARGEAADAARAAGLSSAPSGSVIQIERSGELMVVQVRARVHLPGPVLHGIGWTVRADAAAALEPS